MILGEYAAWKRNAIGIFVLRNHKFSVTGSLTGVYRSVVIDDHVLRLTRATDAGKKVIEIDLTKFEAKLFDLSNKGVRESIIKASSARNFAASSSEFLIVTDEIPTTAFKVIN